MTHASPNLSSNQSPTGLSEGEAAERLARDGANELPAAKPRRFIDTVVAVTTEPMFLLLCAASALYFVLGDRLEACALLVSVLAMMAISIHQQRKTERTLDALRDLTSPRALVRRDGELKRIPGHSVVIGDILVLHEGDRVAADALVLDCHDLLADESLLTGEALPVKKHSWDGVENLSASGSSEQTQETFVYAGTMLVQGQGLARVVATGAASEIGKIGKSLSGLRLAATPLQAETRRLVRWLAIVGLCVCAFVLVFYGLTRADWLGGWLAGITLAMAVLPEEIPVVLTVFLAFGAWRIAQRKVLTRRVETIEALGAATVLCVDKTGTLTQNRMSIRALVANDVPWDVGGVGACGELSEETRESCRPLLMCALLASETEPLDPMEKAIYRFAADVVPAGFSSWRLIHEYELRPDFPVMTHAWRVDGDAAYQVAAKGAPESIVRLCKLATPQATEILTQATQLAANGWRVLAVAQATWRGAEEAWPTSPETFDFVYLGLVALADPIRPAAPAALAQCRTAGIRVVMITGDYPETARAIAAEIGLPAVEVLTGAQIEQIAAMDAAELQRIIHRVNVFARVSPAQKLRLVEAFKANGEVVAMTGDGVNDAPALKAAHIGIAMGMRGTDVAREAASLVLLEDDFESIVAAVRMGRRIFANLRKAVSYLIAVHLPTVGLTLLPLFFGWPLVFLPMHIVFLEFIIDPACSIVFESEPDDADIMHRPPRRVAEPLFGRALLIASVLDGLLAFVLTAAVYVYARYAALGEDTIRMLTFASLIVMNLLLIVFNRARPRHVREDLLKRNAPFRWISLASLAALAAVLFVPALAQLFRFSAPEMRDVAVLLVFSALAVGALALMRRWRSDAAAP